MTHATQAAQVTLFHCPNTRSTGALILLKELEAGYHLHVLNMKAGEQRGAAYLAINPMGKVPAVMHGSALVTEQVAVFLYLADLFPKNGLAPAIGDPLRGPYLRWMAFYGSCFEPALMDRAMKREPAPASTALTWTTAFKLVPDLPVIKAYTDRVNARPAVAWARAKDAELAAGQSA
jgi:glutathione S-transferase